MTKEFRTAAMYRPFYVKALHDQQAAVAEYEADKRDWYENRDGADPEWVRAGDQDWYIEGTQDPDRMVNIGGKGYRYPRCIHGTSLWTDYDNICGPCEDGYSVYTLASMQAREAFHRFNDRWDWYQQMPADFQYQEPEAHQAIVKWVFSQWNEGTDIK